MSERDKNQVVAIARSNPWLTQQQVASLAGVSLSAAVNAMYEGGVSLMKLRKEANAHAFLVHLSPEYDAWLRAQAADASVTPSEMARAILNDAIAEALAK
jgi:hypothetical protein